MKFVFEPVDDFANYIAEDKSKYRTAASAGYIDPDGDFLIGESGGFLFNINFKFTNTDLLKEAALFKLKHGIYIRDKIDSIPHKKFRRREEDRRRNGFTAPCKLLPDGTITNLRITGEHYNFLNYVQILKLDDSTVTDNNTAIKRIGFPKLFDSQYWWYKTKEFSRANGFNVIVCKTRRAGFSYMEGKGSANSVNLKPNKTVLFVAWDKKYITTGNAIANMALDQIDYYETETPFVRGIISRDIEDIKLGYRDKYKRVFGFKSGLVSVSTFNNPNAAVGKDSDEIKVEERGTLPNFDEFMTQTEPTLRTGSYVTGQAIVFGTVNSDSETADDFERDFRNPARWRFMPFENVWDRNKRDEICGFYKPFWWGLEGKHDGKLAMDKDGNTDYRVAIKVAENEHRIKYETAETIKDYIDFKGQYGNTPADSFASSSSNMFTSEELELHYKAVKNGVVGNYYRDGILEEFKDKANINKSVVFRSNDWLVSRGRQKEVHPYITRLHPDSKADNLGCIRLLHPPIKVNGSIPDNIYRIWVDPYGVDKANNKDITRDNSFGSIQVYLAPNNLSNSRGDILVAAYIGRPLKQEQFDKLLLRLSKFYNAKIMTENDRGQVVQDFKHWKETARLVGEPTFTWDTKLQGSIGRGFGISMGAGSSNRRLKGLELLYEWLYTKVDVDSNGNPIYTFQYIHDEGLLNELLKFNLKGNFDRISSMVVGMFDIKEMLYSNVQAKAKPVRNEFSIKRNIFERAWY